MDGGDVPIRFDAPAIIRKWPSLHNARRTDGTGPYLLIEGTLDECIREFMAKPEATRHLYENSDGAAAAIGHRYPGRRAGRRACAAARISLAARSGAQETSLTVARYVRLNHGSPTKRREK